MTKRNRQALFASIFSLVCVIFLARSIAWSDLISVFHRPVLGYYVIPFVVMAWAMLLLYGYRWKLLLTNRLGTRAAVISSIVSLGGNMFLPARGGDILRLHHSHSVGHIPVAELVSRLLVEKVIDLVTICAVGVLAVLYLDSDHMPSRLEVLASLIGSALVLIAVAVALLKYKCDMMVGWLRKIFRKLSREEFFERHVARLLMDASGRFTLETLALPTAITLFMWLAVYATSYVFAAKLVGVSLPYTHALLVLFAGALGLMLPAAPSGVGTFHASVVSAFSLLGRPPAEGLLLATVVHALFFVALAVPAAFVYLGWRFQSRARG